MNLKPKDDKATKIESLLCELLAKEYAVSVENECQTICIFLENWCLYLDANGKWRLE